MAGFAAVLLLAGQAPGAAIPSPWPGVPAVPAAAQWQGVQGNGFSYISRARQAVKIPNQAVSVARYGPPRMDFPPDDPQGRASLEQRLAFEIFLSSPAGAEHGYGVGLPATVRTVAFGTIPVEVRLQVSQLRDADDLPLPLEGSTGVIHYRERVPVRPGFESADFGLGIDLHGKVEVRILQLEVDGLDLGISGICKTAPIDLHLTSEGVWAEDPLYHHLYTDPPIPVGTATAQWYADLGHAGLAGGAVAGTATIPSFTGCRTRSGEDVSRLLSSAVSGPGAEIKIGMSPVDGFGCGSKVPPLNFKGTRAPLSGDPSDCDPAFSPPQFDLPVKDE